MNALNAPAALTAFSAQLAFQLRQALDSFPREFAAARNVQRVFRGYRVRSSIRELSYFVTEIQRVTRGHLGRKRARYVRDMWLHHHHQALQTHLAVSMQRLYRGFRSRKYKHSFYARKRYLAHVNIQNENLRQSMEEQFQAQIERTLAKEEDKARHAFEQTAKSLHHLVSTRAIPGVYNPPWAAADGNGHHIGDSTRELSPSKALIPSAFGIPFETHIKVATIRHLRTEGYRRPIKSTATLLGNTSTLVPAYVSETRGTLQASSPYDAPREAAARDRRISKLTELDARPLVAGGKAAVLEPEYTPTVNATGAFVDMYKTSRMSRDLDNEPEHKAKRVSTVPFVTPYRSTGQMFEESERQRVGMATAMAAATMRAAAMQTNAPLPSVPEAGVGRERARERVDTIGSSATTGVRPLPSTATAQPPIPSPAPRSRMSGTQMREQTRSSLVASSRHDGSSMSRGGGTGKSNDVLPDASDSHYHARELDDAYGEEDSGPVAAATGSVRAAASYGTGSGNGVVGSGTMPRGGGVVRARSGSTSARTPGVTVPFASGGGGDPFLAGDYEGPTEESKAEFGGRGGTGYVSARSRGGAGVGARSASPSGPEANRGGGGGGGVTGSGLRGALPAPMSRAVPTGDGGGQTSLPPMRRSMMASAGRRALGVI